ncbi:porin [Pollutibacter soli]|uniref:porin n=1 Tax=Pollutibacter soli TaxID=3034157 RepID=UPI003013B6FE
MLRKISLLAIAMAGAQYGIAQDTTVVEEKKSTTTISGFADVYYRYDFNKNISNNRTSFTNSQNSFELGMASLRIDHTIGKVSMTADLGFGKRAQEFSYNESGIVAAIKQLYVSYAATDWLKFTAGSWATHVGYELVDAPANRNYSMSYMFSYGPFFHTGVKAEMTFGKLGLMAGIANPTDWKSAPVDSKKFALAQVSYAFNDNWKAYLNYVGGQRPSDSAKTNQLDLVITGKLSDKFSIGANTTVQMQKYQVDNKYESDAKKWWGAALYLSADPSELFGLTLRSEIFGDKQQLAAMSYAPVGANVWANTLSANFRLFGALTIIPELRFENSSQKIFYDEEGAAKGSYVSGLIAAVYKF